MGKSKFKLNTSKHLFVHKMKCIELMPRAKDLHDEDDHDDSDDRQLKGKE